MTAPALVDGQTKHRLSVDEFLLLDREGAFGCRSTELIGGEVNYMSRSTGPMRRPSAICISPCGTR